MSGNYTIIEVANMSGIPVNTVRSRLKNGYYNGTYNFTDNNGNQREFTVTEDDIKDISKKGSKRRQVRLTPNFLQAVILEKEKNNEHRKIQQKLLTEKSEIEDSSENLARQLGQRILESFNKDKNLENNDALNEMKLAAEIAVEFDNRYVDKYRKKLRALELKCNDLELKYNDLELKYTNLKSENNNIKYTYEMATTDTLKNKKTIEFKDYMEYEQKRKKIEEAKKCIKEWEEGNFLTINPTD